jgi:hypothetical protein
VGKKLSMVKKNSMKSMDDLFLWEIHNPRLRKII